MVLHSERQRVRRIASTDHGQAAEIPRSATTALGIMGLRDPPPSIVSISHLITPYLVRPPQCTVSRCVLCIGIMWGASLYSARICALVFKDMESHLRHCEVVLSSASLECLGIS